MWNSFILTMQKTRSNKGKKKAEIRQQPTPPTQDELSDGLNALEHDDPMEKDETELELEKLVFGDDEGFREGLRSYRQDVGYLGSGRDDDGREDDMDGPYSETEEQDLDALEDADVSSQYFLWAIIAKPGLSRLYSSSSSSLTQAHPHLAPKL